MQGKQSYLHYYNGNGEKKNYKETTIPHPKPLNHNAEIEEELSNTISSIT